MQTQTSNKSRITIVEKSVSSSSNNTANITNDENIIMTNTKNTNYKFHQFKIRPKIKSDGRQEIWKPMLEFGNNVEISNLGRFLRNGKVANQHFRGGYLSVRLKDMADGKWKAYYVHRLVCHYFIGPCPKGMVVNHKNSIKRDNKLENLEYVTLSGNAVHAVESGTLKPITKQVRIERMVK